MSVTNPTYLHQFLKELHAKPKKSLSQNFLIDQNIVAKIIKMVAPETHDSILEIGPGPGALTESLIQTSCHLTLVEKDFTFAKALQRFPQATLFEGDVFDFDFTTLLQKTKVVSNLPYHLTSPILTTLLPQFPRFSSLTLMMQKEVAERLMAKPATSSYGALTLFCRFYAEITDAFIVKASCFYPRPKVDSMVVHFSLRPVPENIDAKAFFALTRTAFSQRRKMLRVSLKELYGERLLQACEKASILPTARAETLSFEEFLSLSSHLSK